MTPVVSLRNVAKSYLRGKQQVEVLHGVNLDIAPGEFLALMGPSGSGKTTMLNLIAGLDQPTSGEVYVAGERIDSLSRAALATWRSHHIGFVFQFYNLLPVLTAEANVEVPLLLTSLSRSERRKRVETALRLVGLADRGRHKPNELSVNSSASPSRAHSSPIQRCWCATSLLVTSTGAAPRKSWTCCRP
jgi:putative ABC transport system ATP-binding protein